MFFPNLTVLSCLAQSDALLRLGTVLLLDLMTEQTVTGQRLFLGEASSYCLFCPEVVRLMVAPATSSASSIELVFEEQLASIGGTNEKDSQQVETCPRLADANVSPLQDRETRRSAIERIEVTHSPTTFSVANRTSSQTPRTCRNLSAMKSLQTFMNATTKTHCPAVPRNLEHKITLTSECHACCKIGHVTLDAMFPGLMTRARVSCSEVIIFRRRAVFLSDKQSQTIRGLFITIQSLSFCAPRTVVTSPSDHSSAVPLAAVTSSTSIVCTVPGFHQSQIKSLKRTSCREG